jgi:hypothetical protein
MVSLVAFIEEKESPDVACLLCLCMGCWYHVLELPRLQTISQVKFYYFVALGFELRASHMLGRLSYTSSSFLLFFLWRWGLVNYLPGLASNHEPPDLSLQVTVMSHGVLTQYCF